MQGFPFVWHMLTHFSINRWVTFMEKRVNFSTYGWYKYFSLVVCTQRTPRLRLPRQRYGYAEEPDVAGGICQIANEFPRFQYLNQNSETFCVTCQFGLTEPADWNLCFDEKPSRLQQCILFLSAPASSQPLADPPHLTFQSETFARFYCAFAYGLLA